MRRSLSIVTIPFLAPIILFIHTSLLDGSLLLSALPILLASVLPSIGIAYYARRGIEREMRSELSLRWKFMISLGPAIMLIGFFYRRLGYEHSGMSALLYGLGTLIAGILTLLGHKTSVHTMARSVSGFIELHYEPLLGLSMIAMSLIAAASRLKLKAHTPAQVLSGFLLGPLVFLFLR